MGNNCLSHPGNIFIQVENEWAGVKHVWIISVMVSSLGRITEEKGVDAKEGSKKIRESIIAAGVPISIQEHTLVVAALGQDFLRIGWLVIRSLDSIAPFLPQII